MNKKINHLPIATFDIWKLAINETSFLACLFVHDHDDIIEKLEIELPLIWELVYLEDWEHALNLYKKKLSTSLGEEDKEYINELLQKKIKKIELLGLSMTSVGQILRKRLLNEKSLELSALKQYGSEFLKPILTPWYQDLLRRQAESKWPQILQKLINDKCLELPDDYISLLKTHHKFQNPVVYLPLLLALRVLSKNKSNWPCNATELFKIQELKRFDEDWFNSVFQLLSGWLSQQKNGVVLNVD